MKNLIKIGIALALSFVFVQCKQEVKQNVIKCEIDGLEKGDKVILSLGGGLNDTFERVDSIEYNGQGAFDLKTVACDVNATITLLLKKNSYKEIKNGMGNFPLFLEGYSTLEVKGNVDTFPLSDISGGIYELPELGRINQFYNEVKKIQKFATLKYKGKIAKKDDISTDSLFRLFGKAEKLEMDSIFPLEQIFVKKNPDVAYSALLFCKNSQKGDFKAQEYLFTELSDRVKNTPIGKKVQKYVVARKATEVGGIAPNFTIKDSKGKEISLTDYRGKFVLLEFWGTWCGGCVANIPVLKKLRKDTPQDKLVMLSIACREPSEQVWKNLIEKENVGWVQALSKDKKVEQLYPYSAFPAFFLINPEGTVIGKSVGLTPSMVQLIKESIE